MFDIGFSELFMIAVVALVVLGPERLPKAARFAGLWVRRARAQWYSVKSELERELASDELKRSLHDTRQAMADIGADMRDAQAQARREFDTMQAQLRQDAVDAADDNTALIDPQDKALLAPAEDSAAPAIATAAPDGSSDVRR